MAHKKATTANQGVGGIVLIVLGVLFLLGQIFHISLLGALWPLFIIGPGAAFLYAARNNKSVVGLAVPGSIVTGTGLILLYQALTGHWESWAYAWALYPVFFGMALRYMGQQTDDAKMAETGQGFMKWGGMGFVGLAALFELFIFNGGGIFGTLLLPLVMIAGGAWLLLRRGEYSRSYPARKTKISDELVIPDKPKNRPLTRSERLRAEIDAALAEDDAVPVDTSTNHTGEA